MPSIRVNEITSSTVLIIIFLSISESYINLASSIIIHLGSKFVTSISLMVSTTGSKNIKPSLSLNRARVNNHSIEEPDDSEIEQAAQLINAAERPVIYAGGGIIISEASQEL